MESELLARCRDGDEVAWRELYRAHFPFVWRVARRLGIPDSERGDVCQEVFLVAFRKLGAFRQGRLSTWLYRIAANVCSDRHRRRRLREALLSLWGERPAEKVAPRTPLTDYESREAEAAVGEVLSRMAPKKREVFALYELERLSAEEIAERVGCKLKTVWTRLHYARKDFERIARKRGCVP
ncbi:MAG: RNA polymerase sigma factor [Myxococcales bacterium]|nr:RNA polymerase sigma factor [Myxococcales bacterium]